ncbi:unnamed protein product [Penicillium roqueforti FM164]|uniref:Genomic scaffold, ProqFM164S03 n=1 Tax=Penicillium roqueforti (strain FM164) TaxID=1365484 RepID=W6QAR4_PENRF|nr:unnamed protein product [Penicillium roqueforti FM164]
MQLMRLVESWPDPFPLGPIVERQIGCDREEVCPLVAVYLSVYLLSGSKLHHFSADYQCHTKG